MSLLRKIFESAGWANIGTKMNLIVGCMMVGMPLALLIYGETRTHAELMDQLGLWIIVGLIATLPLSKLFSYLLALYPIQQLNGLCLEIQKGNFNPFAEVPPEPSKQDELQTLRHNMFWMGHVLGSRYIELANTMDQLKSAQKQIQSSVDYAQLIQKAFLPSREELSALFSESFLLWEQRDGVGGDFYWLRKTENGFFLAAIDCTGHGVPGAFMTLIVKSLLDKIDAQSFEQNPAGILREMNGLIKQALSCNESRIEPADGMDCAFIYIDDVRESLVFAGARNYLFHRKNDGNVVTYRGDRKSVGNNSGLEDVQFSNHKISICRGDRIYMLTDGLLDQIGGARRLPFGRKQFIQVIAEEGVSLQEQKDTLSEMLTVFQGDEIRRDDVLVIGAVV